VIAIGETFDGSPELAASYCDTLHTALNFDFLQRPWRARPIQHSIQRWDALLASEKTWPSYVLSNHDNPRHAWRHGRGLPRWEADARAKVAATLLLTLRGTPFVYYGEEIGMTDGTIPAAERDDIRYLRDAARTPMQWNDQPHAGFSRAQPWLRLADDSSERNVAQQEYDPRSILNAYRRLIALRRTSRPLQVGDWSTLVETPRDTLVYLAYPRRPERARRAELQRCDDARATRRATSRTVVDTPLLDPSHGHRLDRHPGTGNHARPLRGDGLRVHARRWVICDRRVARHHGRRAVSATRPIGGHVRPEPITIVPGIWRVGGGSWGGVSKCISSEEDANAYLLDLGGATVLVDAGTEAGFEAVRTNMQTAGTDPNSLTDILITHSHWDHTQAAARWQRRCSARTHLNAVGAEFLARGDHRLVGHHLHGPRYAFEPFRVDHAASDGEQFQLGRASLTTRTLPGHSPDSTLYAFGHGGAQVAVGGDLVFGPRERDTFVLGQLCSLWLSNLDDYVASLKRMGDLTIDVLLPGHGEPISGRSRVRDAIVETLGVASVLAGDTNVRGNCGV
jgi:glyoxylase-like metal-dependent hydrolase (beta-lactamase superfamily II)